MIMHIKNATIASTAMMRSSRFTDPTYHTESSPFIVIIVYIKTQNAGTFPGDVLIVM